jgi:ABC-type sugar transport system substrate-binding protein
MAASLACVAALGLAGCGSSGSGGATANGSKKITVGLSVNGAAIPFYETLRKSTENAAKKAGVHLIVSTPTDVQSQSQSLSSLLAQHVQAIIVAPIDAHAVVPQVKQANAQHIPVITVDESTAGGSVYTYISSPNQDGGVLAGQWIVKNMPSGGELGLIPGANGDTTSNQRTAGVMSVLRKHPNIKVISSAPGNWVTDEAFKVATPMLTAHPNIKMIFALNDGMAMGAVQAAKSVYHKSIPIIGYNGDPIAFTAIKKGQMAATVAQDPTKMGQVALQNALNSVKGKPSPGPAINVPIHVIDKSNISTLN